MKKPQPPADLWTRMDAIVGEILKDDEGFTQREFMERYKTGHTTANARLQKLVGEGRLIVGKKRKPSGGFMKVYRPA